MLHQGMISRPDYLERIDIALKRSPIAALPGPGQCGKTTLARRGARDVKATFFDLDSQQDLARLQNRELTLSSPERVVIIDEIQQMPQLFSVLRVLADRESTTGRFLILISMMPISAIGNLKKLIHHRLIDSALVPFQTINLGFC